MAACWAGVDGCRGGWVLAVVDDTRFLTDLRVVRTFSETVIHGREARVTLVDIPIGLPSEERPQARWCDEEARRYLGPRASSVFPVPAREAVWESSYETAGRENNRILGSGLSKQSWGMCPKIREADAVFRLAPALQSCFRETHPELCFRLLHGARPLEHPKKTRAGLRLRRELLRSRVANLDAVLRRFRGARPDDLLDAVAAAVVARLVSEGRVAAIRPVAEQRDACGLVMEVLGI
jgi:predicted RNase H-like nuclease